MERHIVNSSETVQVTGFVRGTLGCQCPDEVFRSITVESRDPVGGSPPFTRLTIGDRLLIYLARPRPADSMAATISGLARLGQAERTNAGYNRFRLVIARTDNDVRDSAARQVFAESTGQDARAHVHFVAPDEVPEVILASLDSGTR